MRSKAAKSSGVNAQSAALTFDKTCSGLETPAMTLAMCGWDASHETANSSTLWPRAVANSCKRSIRSKVVSLSRWVPRPPAARRVPAGGGSPRRYLPVSSPRWMG